MSKKSYFTLIIILIVISVAYAMGTWFYDEEIDVYCGDYYSYWNGTPVSCISDYNYYGYSFDLDQIAWKVEVEVFGGSCNYEKTFFNVSNGSDFVNVDDGKVHWFYIRAYFYTPAPCGSAGTWSGYPVEEEQKIIQVNATIN